MYNQQATHTSGTSKRTLRRFVKMRLPAIAKQKKILKKKGAVESQQRSWRLKRISQKALLCLLMPILFISLSWLVYNLLLYSDIFRMTEITVQGNLVTSQKQILKSTGLQRGTNLLDIDLSKIQASVRKELWVEDVHVSRHWPSTVSIVIQEYKPFALVNLESDGIRQLYYMSNKGVVFAPSSADKDLDYPVVNGSGLTNDLQGKKFIEGSLGSMALEFLKLTDKGNQILPTQAVSEINVDPDDGLVVYLVDHPFPIYMGKEKIRLRFQRLVRVLAKLYKEDNIKEVSEIRMDYAENKILVAKVDETS